LILVVHRALPFISSTWSGGSTASAARRFAFLEGWPQPAWYRPPRELDRQYGRRSFDEGDDAGAQTAHIVGFGIADLLKI
jgi:hypothetical protein